MGLLNNNTFTFEDERNKKPAAYPRNNTAKSISVSSPLSPTNEMLPEFKPADQMMEETAPPRTNEERWAEYDAALEEILNKRKPASPYEETTFNGTAGRTETRTQEQIARENYDKQVAAQQANIANGLQAVSDSDPFAVAPMNMGYSEYINFLRAYETSGKRSVSDKREMALSLDRMRKGEFESKKQQETDYAKVALFLESSEWKTVKPGYNGTTRVNRKAGGKGVETVMADLIQGASAKVIAGISDQDFSTSAEISDWVSIQTGVPGGMVLDRLAMQEYRKARAMGIDNPLSQPALFPVLAASARAAQKEQLAFELSARKQTQEQDLEYEIEKQYALEGYGGGTKSGTTARTGYQATNFIKVENGEPTLVDQKEKQSANPFSIFTSTATVTRTSIPTPNVVVRKIVSGLPDGIETEQKFAEAIASELHKTYPDLTDVAAEDLFGQSVQREVEQFSAKKDEQYVKDLKSDMDSVSTMISAAKTVSGGKMEDAFPVVDTSDPNNKRIVPINDYIFGVFIESGASPRLLDEVLNALANRGQSAIPEVQKQITELAGSYSPLAKKAMADEYSKGLESTSSARDWFATSSTEVIADSNNANRIITNDEGVVVYAPLSAQDMKKELSSKNALYIKNPESGGIVSVVVGTENLLAEEQEVLKSFQYMQNIGSDQYTTPYPGLKQKVSEAWKMSVYSGEYYVRIPGQNNPEKITIIDGEKLADALSEKGVMRIPKPDSFTDFPESVRAYVPYISEGLYEALLHPSSVDEIVVSTKDQEALVNGIPTYADRFVSEEGGKKTIENMYTGKDFTGSGLENLPGPFKDLAFDGKEVFLNFMKNVINGDTENGKVISALLYSDNVNDVNKGLAGVDKVAEEYVRLPISATALAFSAYGADVKSGLKIIENGLDNEKDVSGFINYAASLVGTPPSDKDINVTIKDATRTINAIRTEYNSLGEDVEARRKYQETYKDIIDSHYYMVSSSLDTMNKQGMIETYGNKFNGKHAKEYYDLMIALMSASETLNMAPELGDVKRQISIAKYYLNNPSEITTYRPRTYEELNPKLYFETTLAELPKRYNIDPDTIPASKSGRYEDGTMKQGITQAAMNLLNNRYNMSL